MPDGAHAAEQNYGKTSGRGLRCEPSNLYYHFQDIYALLGWIYETEAVESIHAYRSYNTWTEGFYKIFCYIENNKAFCCNTLESLGRSHLDGYLYQVTHDLIMGVIDELACRVRIRSEDKEFVANFIRWLLRVLLSSGCGTT